MRYHMAPFSFHCNYMQKEREEEKGRRGKTDTEIAILPFLLIKKVTP